MTEDKDVQYMRTALGMCGVGVSDCTSEIILRVFDSIKEMGGDFDLMTAAKIQAEVEEKYNKIIPCVSISGLEKFYDDTVDQLHTRGDENPLTPDMIVAALKELIETHKDIPI